MPQPKPLSNEMSEKDKCNEMLHVVLTAWVTAEAKPKPKPLYDNIIQKVKREEMLQAVIAAWEAAAAEMEADEEAAWYQDNRDDAHSRLISETKNPLFNEINQINQKTQEEIIKKV